MEDKQKRTKGIVCNYGINDMPYGWTRENEYNKRVYQCWHDMITRCYNKKRKSYKYYGEIGCYVCDRWLILSNFIEDIDKINGYELWLNNKNKYIALDKDINSNGNNKCYCLEECQFVKKSTNTKQANKTKKYEYMNNNKYALKNIVIARYDKDGMFIDKDYQYNYEKLGFDRCSIHKCLIGKLKTVGTGKGTEKFIFRYWNGDIDE